MAEIKIELTPDEDAALKALSESTELSPDRVMIQALRFYQAHMNDDLRPDYEFSKLQTKQLDFAAIETWGDLKETLRKCSIQQLKKPVQVIKHHPVDENVHECLPGISFGTIDALDIRYARSSVDNRRHGDELAIFVDYNPFGVDGAVAYEGFSKKKPIYSKDHDDGQDWTGPAQKLADAEPRNESPNIPQNFKNLLDHRLKNLEKRDEEDVE